jgi:hypothetical protein
MDEEDIVEALRSTADALKGCDGQSIRLYGIPQLTLIMTVSPSTRTDPEESSIRRHTRPNRPSSWDGEQQRYERWKAT